MDTRSVVMPMKEKLTCPSCGSHDVQMAHVIYEQGTSSGIGGAMLGNEIGITTMSSSTAMARRWAPPAAPSYFISNVVTGIGGVIAAICLLLTIWAIFDSTQPHNAYEKPLFWGLPALGVLIGSMIYLAGMWGKRGRAEAIEDARLRRRLWAETWVCLRCGSGFRE